MTTTQNTMMIDLFTGPYADLLHGPQGLTTQAIAKYPEEVQTIFKAARIVQTHGVVLLGDGMAHVRSDSDPNSYYTVGRTCTCVHANTKAPEGRCKHVWAKCLDKRILKAQHLTHPVWYAQYQDGETLVSGTAREDGAGQWVFTPEDGSAEFWTTRKALTLCGHKATADAQAARDEA